MFLGEVPVSDTISVLGKFAAKIPDYGFDNVTKIFQANVPLLKFTDVKSGMEVDFCINNELGVRNSLLLLAYCRYDDRVLHCGRLIKEWAKRHELVGTADGNLNSYAYMLLVIHYLQSTKQPVVPNLQKLTEVSHPIVDYKWSSVDRWETKFVHSVEKLRKSENTQGLGELLIGFFRYFTQFDWSRHAVCMRLNEPNKGVDKYSLATPINEEHWYVEDPFDLKHNLAAKCTRVGRRRLLDVMRETLNILKTEGSWEKALPQVKPDSFFLKCRISEGVTPHALLEEFEQYDLVKLHFPASDGPGRFGQAFLEFNSALSRRRAHTKNETYVADCQLQLHYATKSGLHEAAGAAAYSTYEISSYQMQRQVLAARGVPQPTPQRAREAVATKPSGSIFHENVTGAPSCQVVPNEAMQYSYARPPQMAQSMQPAHVSYSSIRDPQHSLLATMNVEPVQFKSPLVAGPSQKSRIRTGDNKVPVSAMVLPSQIVATKGPPFALNRDVPAKLKAHPPMAETNREIGYVWLGVRLESSPQEISLHEHASTLQKLETYFSQFHLNERLAKDEIAFHVDLQGDTSFCDNGAFLLPEELQHLQTVQSWCEHRMI